MDDGSTTLGGRPDQPPTSPISPGSARRGVQRHHRRRRAVALAVLVGLPILIALVMRGSGGAAAHHGVAGTQPGYFARLQTLAGTGTGSFLAADRTAETAAIERTLAYTPYVRIAGSQHKEIALTFDDGPGPFTPRLVAKLQRLNAPGTFFEVGTVETDFHAGTSLIAAAGYPVGDHTETHAPMSRLPEREQESQLTGAIRALGRYGAPYPRLFRPPYGLWNHTTLALLNKYRMLMVLWTVDTADYTRPGVRAIVHRAVSGARPGAIILMHDAGGNRSETIAAVPRIVKQLRARGYRIVTIPKLLLDNPAPADQQIAALRGSGG